MTLAALVSPTSARGDVSDTQQLPPQAHNGYLEQHTVSLWPGEVPNAKGEGFHDQTILTIYPPGQQPNGTAVIIASGVAYQVLSDNTEGRRIANWFNTRGVVAFVLKYRLGPQYPMPVPLEDAQRAMRWVRAHAKDSGIDPNRVGMVGFSSAVIWPCWPARGLSRAMRMPMTRSSVSAVSPIFWYWAIRRW